MSKNIQSELISDVRRGEYFKQVIESEPWAYVLGRAAEEVDEAVSELKSVDPENRAEIIRLQNVIARNEGIGGWLRDILVQGEQARELLISNNMMEEQVDE